MMPDSLETVLQLVAEGRLTAEEAAPLIAALTAPRGAETPPRAGAAATSGGAAGEEAAGGGVAPRFIHLEVSERGRTVVNLRVPMAFGRSVADLVPGLSAEYGDRLREALSARVRGRILDILDEDGDGIRITME